MPGLDGFQACRRLKDDAATHPIPVMVVSARDSANWTTPIESSGIAVLVHS